MNFQEAVSYLYSLGNEVTAMKLGLDSTRKLLRALGDPHEKYLKIQIAGTNGKGSTCAFLDSICQSANIKTGLTTSPHLVSITERIKIGGAEISEIDFARHATLIRKTSEKLVAAGGLESVPTFFEQVTAIALNAFAEAKIELAILETGLGGRFDSMTATNAEIVAITPIDYDHQKILGDTLEKIAAEKAAIIRPDTKVFVAPQKKEAAQVITGKCLEVSVEPVWAKPDVTVIEDLGGWLYVNFKTAATDYINEMQMLGKHQWTNANLAIYIAESLHDYGFKISRKNIETGVENARHSGRLEFYKGLLFDGAHNQSGAQALADYLDEFVKQPITMIFGAMRDKDLTEMAQILFLKADKLILTKPENERSMDIEELKSFAPLNFDQEKIFLAETVGEAIKLARKITAERGLILITGSLYLVGEAQKILAEEKSE